MFYYHNHTDNSSDKSYDPYIPPPKRRATKMLNKRYKLEKKIGEGAFGQIFKAIDIYTKEEIAIKMEKNECKYKQVVREARIIKGLGMSCRSIGIPRVKWYGMDKDHSIMAMELLGMSLEECFQKCNRKFSLKTILMICDQMLKRVQFIHHKNYIHRDIKPDNFLIGTGKKSHIIHMIDFGLAKQYRDKRQNHIAKREDKHLTGTARYASINNHLGIEQSRRDDLESLGYIFLYFLSGKLPWQGLQARSKSDKYQRICDKKTSISVHKLCEDYPSEFRCYLTYVRTLEFKDRPDYGYLRKMFKDLFIRKGFKLDYRYDWILVDEKKLNEDSDDDTDSEYFSDY